MRVFVMVILTLLSIQLSSQIKWNIQSGYLSTPDTILVFKPANYTEKISYPLVYLLHGYSMNVRQWTDIIDCQSFADRYNMIVVCPEGFTSFYSNSVYLNEDQYESFFFHDLVPKVHEKFNIDKKNIFISGLSMGGYGALKLFLTHQDYFSTAGSTSGALAIDYNLSNNVSLQFWNNDRMVKDMKQIFGNPIENNWNTYSILSLLKNQHTFNKPFIFDCGTEDILYPINLELFTYIYQKNIPATFISQPGNHDTNYWNKSIEHHFIFFNQNIK